MANDVVKRSVVIHISNEDPVLADMQELPGPSAVSITFTNPRKRDGKNVNWITPGAVLFVFPMSRINFIEVLTTEEEVGGVIKPWRE